MTNLEITFKDGIAYAPMVYGVRPLVGRFVALKKLGNALIISANEADNGIRVSIAQSLPHPPLIVFFPFDSPDWSLIYNSNRCCVTRAAVDMDGANLTLLCVKSSAHKGAHHYELRIAHGSGK